MLISIRRLRVPDYVASIWPVAITLTCAFGLWLLLFGNPLEIIELRWVGQLLRWRAVAKIAPAVDPHLVLLDIDRGDYERFPTIACEYQTAARIIREAGELGARIVLFDIIFSRGSREESQPILDAIDEARKKGTQVVLAEALVPAKDNAQPPARIRSFPFAEGLMQPAGLINVQSDSDGVLRHYSLVVTGRDGPEPSLALAAYLASLDLNWTDVSFPNRTTVSWPELGRDNVSTIVRKAAVEPVLLNFRTNWDFQTDDVNAAKSAFIHYNLEQLHREYQDNQRSKNQSRLVKKTLDGCILAVSYIITGIGDVGTTTMGANQPRVVLHVQALNDLIQHSFLERTSRVSDAALLLMVLLLSFFANRSPGVVLLFVLWVGGILFILSLDTWLVIMRNTVFGAVYLASLWTAISVTEVARRYVREFIERLKLRTTMGFYFSPRVLERVLSNPGSTEPQEAQLTVLLTDLRNSTPLAERLGTNGFFALLNQVFEIQTLAVTAEDGNLEHFLGDQFLSYWGAPHPQPDASDRALRAAFSLIAAMKNFCERLPTETRELFGYGVALHSGSALVGNKGSRLRLDYGVVGDLVNTAARVESLTKYYGIQMLLTQDVYAKLTRQPPSRLLDHVVVMGKSIPIEILEVKHPCSKPNFEEIAQRYAEAFASYRRGQFDVAEQLFSRLATSENDPPSLLLMRRCAELRAHPRELWEGIFRLETK